MRPSRSAVLTFAVVLALPSFVRAVGPTVAFTVPAENVTPGTFGALPFPNDLYFDQGRPGDGDGTLLDASASIGLSAQVIQQNAASIEDAFDEMDGFGTTSAIYFFFSGPIDPGSLPASPVLTPALSDAVFCAEATTGTPVPILLKPDVDSRIDNVLGILPVPGRPLAPSTTYACVVRTSLTGGGDPVEAAADWLSVRDGTSANADADAIHDPVVTLLGGLGVPASAIAGMTVFTTEKTTTDLVSIQADVLPPLSLPTADFTSRPELVFSGPAALAALLGSNPHDHVATIATGFFPAPRFQTADPDGTNSLHDLPQPPGFVTCIIPCETNDERFTRDGLGRPVVLGTSQVPVTVVVPSGTPPAGGWPVIIQQHGLGGQRDTVVAFGEADAAAGFASIGIDSVAHGYRFFDCTPAAPCSQDNANNVGGTAVPDGFVDGTFAGFSTSFLTVNLGFFQAFHNFLGIRDNFRQTYADLLSLVRLVQGGSIDTALGTQLDPARIFYMGHSLGGLMGSGFVPIEPNLQASLLNATGGGLTNQLFINSSIGAGAQALVNGILGLDPANIADQFGMASNLIQMVIDPGDGVNSASLLLAPAAGMPRNVIQVEDFGDQVVPNQANEAVALAAGLPLFDPFVQNLHQSALTLPVVATPHTVSGNGPGGATAALVQNGPATHAASLGTVTGTLTFVPEFAHWEEFPATGQSFPNLARGIGVPNAGMLDEVLAWFRDVADNGPPGTFSFADDPNYNPVENRDVPAGASTQTFLARTVNAGGAVSFPEPTPDVVFDFAANAIATRMTAARSILGSGPFAGDRDVPPGPQSTVGTPGILPFFVTLQRAVPGLFGATVTVAYDATELGVAGIPDGSPDEEALVVATFTAGTCMTGGAPCSENGECGANGPCVGASYTPLPTTIDTALDTATATGVSAVATFAVLHPDALALGYRPPLVAGGGAPRTDCRAEWMVMNPNNTPFLDRRGRVSSTQVCGDGDPTCDADRTADGTCGVRVGICLDQADPTVPQCTPGSAVTSYTLRQPVPTALDAAQAADAQALLDVLLDLPGAQIAGARQNQVRFTPPLAGSPCSALATLHVAAGTTRSLSSRTRLQAGFSDGDRLRLRCLPAT